MAENGTSQSSADCHWLAVRRFADSRVVETELPCDDRLSPTVRIQLGRALKSLFSCIRASLFFHSPNKTHTALCVLVDSPPPGRPEPQSVFVGVRLICVCSWLREVCKGRLRSEVPLVPAQISGEFSCLVGFTSFHFKPCLTCLHRCFFFFFLNPGYRGLVNEGKNIVSDMPNDIPPGTLSTY